MVGLMTGISVRTHRLTNFEELNAAVEGARSEVVQLDPGRVTGFISHLSVDGLPVNLGEFSVGVRSRGVLSADRTTIGMLTATQGRVTHWSRDMYPGDVLVTPPGVEHGGRYYGGAAFATMSLSHHDISMVFGQEPRICDPQTWQKSHWRNVPDPRFVSRILETLRQVITMHAVLTNDAIRFWRRAFVEMMTHPVIQNVPADGPVHLPSALRVAREAERYIDQNSARPLHISEICNELKVSRRSLHRAFHETLGIGPVGFLRRKRLCSVHTALLQNLPRTTTIAEIALQHGFLHLGRFSGEYRTMFGESPSQTLGQGCRKTRSPDEHLLNAFAPH
jgi:AraC family ethanolamine operon transcriptional activator